MTEKRLGSILRFVTFILSCGLPWLVSMVEKTHNIAIYNTILFILYFIIVFMLFAASFIINALVKLKSENEAYKRTLYRCNHKKYVHTDGDDELFILREDIPEIIECLYDIQKASKEEYR